MGICIVVGAPLFLEGQGVSIVLLGNTVSYSVVLSSSRSVRFPWSEKTSVSVINEMI